MRLVGFIYEIIQGCRSTKYKINIVNFYKNELVTTFQCLLKSNNKSNRHPHLERDCWSVIGAERNSEKDFERIKRERTLLNFYVRRVFYNLFCAPSSCDCNIATLLVFANPSRCSLNVDSSSEVLCTFTS